MKPYTVYSPVIPHCTFVYCQTSADNENWGCSYQISVEVGILRIADEYGALELWTVVFIFRKGEPRIPFAMSHHGYRILHLSNQ